jgi:parvulin-like peptidyl-prolyl isomerase
MQLSTQLKGKELESKIQGMKLDLLNKLVSDRLVLQEAKKAKININEERVKERIEEIRKRYPSDLDFQKGLQKQGLTQADLEQKLREQFLTYAFMETKFKSKIIVNPSEVTEFYQAHPDEFLLPEIREVSSVSLQSEALSKEIVQKIKSAEALEALAEKYSLAIDRMKVIKNGQLKKEIEDTIFNLNIKEVSEPVKVGDRFYIFLLDNIIPPREQTLAEVQEEIYKFLFDNKLQKELSKWLDEVKKNSYITILQ